MNSETLLGVTLLFLLLSSVASIVLCLLTLAAVRDIREYLDEGSDYYDGPSPAAPRPADPVPQGGDAKVIPLPTPVPYGGRIVDPTLDCRPRANVLAPGSATPTAFPA